MYVEAQDKKIASNNNNIIITSNSSASLIQRSSVGKNSYNNKNNTNENVLRLGIIPSEPGQPEQLKVQRTIILPHRQDGKDYTGILTFTASL
jgi:hypothetical protein